MALLRRQWLLAVLCAGLAACRDPTSPDLPVKTAPPAGLPTEQSFAPSGSGPFSDRLIVVDPAQLILVSTTEEQAGGLYRLRVSVAPDRVPVAGDFVYLDQPRLLRRVISSTAASDEIRLQTMQGFWHEVIIGGTYRFSGAFPALGSPPSLAAPAAPSAPLPDLGNRVDSLDLCPVVDSILGFPLICGSREKTKIDKGPVELNGRVDSVFVVTGSVSLSGDMDGTYTIDPGGSIIPNTGRAPVFSPCDSYPGVVGCFAKVGDALRAFLIWVGINPNVLPPLRACVPGSPIVIDRGSLFPFRAPDVRICRITDWGEVPDFTPPGLQSAVVDLHPRLAAELVVDVAASGTLKLTIPVPGLGVVKCAGILLGHICLKFGFVIPLQLHLVEGGGQLQLKGEAVEKIRLTWTPETEWIHQRENEYRSFQGNFIPNNPADTVSFRFGAGFVLGAELCLGPESASGCVDKGDGTTGAGFLYDLQIGIKAKVQISHNMEGVWSRDPTFDNWHIDIDGFDELELEGGLILPKLLLRLDKNLKRSWTVQCCRMETQDLHGAGLLAVTTKSTGNVGDPDGYRVTLFRADTLPAVSDPGTTRLSSPAWADTLEIPIGINTTSTFYSADYCGALYSDQIFVSVPFLIQPAPPQIIPFGVLVPAARRLGIGIPNFSWEAGCGMLVADYIATLSDVADHCKVVGDASKRVRLEQASQLPPVRDNVAGVEFEVACDDPSTMPGSLHVTTSATGVNPDPNGYRIELDGMSQDSIPSNGEATLSGLTPGLGRMVGLTGVAPNCIVQVANPRQVDIPSGEQAEVHFDVFCSLIVLPQTVTGSLQITTITTGTGPDADGYSVDVNGVASGSIGPNAQLTLSSLRSGATDVVLRGLASNCTVASGTWVKLDIPAGGVAAVQYAVSCEGPSADAIKGGVRIRVTTSGTDLDPDGYVLDIGGVTAPISINDERTLDGLNVGTTLVELGGVAPNCGVQTPLPLSVPVVAGEVAEAAIAVRCQAYGRIEVRTALSGRESDPDGYRLAVDGMDKGPLGTAETRVVGQIVSGDHAVLLDGLASFCRVEAIEEKGSRRTRSLELPVLANPVVVSVAPGETATVQFTVGCVAPDDMSIIRFRVREEGAGGAGSYSAWLDGVRRGTVAAGAELLVPDVFPDAHVVQLEGIPAACKINGQNPRVVTVPRGQTHPIEFNLVCTKGKP